MSDESNSKLSFNEIKYADILKICKDLTHKQRRSFIKREKRRINRKNNAKINLVLCNNYQDVCHEKAVVDYMEENARANKLWMEYEEELKDKARKVVQEQQEKHAIESPKIEQDPMDKETEINHLLLSIDEELKEWHNPFAPDDYQEEDEKLEVQGIRPMEHCHSIPTLINEEQKSCSFFDKVGACRFGNACSRQHNYPTRSCVILFQNMFNIFAFEMSARITRNMDVDLEYSDSELRDDFKQFQDDALDELKKYGKIVQFKVCCNTEPHLQGNVYVQYDNENESQLCYDKTNGRYYNNKIMLPRFVSIASWRIAICGMDYNKKACSHGRNCNFLHVFHSKRFKYADCDDLSYSKQKKKRKSRSHSKERTKHKKHKKKKSKMKTMHTSQAKYTLK